FALLGEWIPHEGNTFVALVPDGTLCVFNTIHGSRRYPEEIATLVVADALAEDNCDDAFRVSGGRVLFWTSSRKGYLREVASWGATQEQVQRARNHLYVIALWIALAYRSPEWQSPPSPLPASLPGVSLREVDGLLLLAGNNGEVHLLTAYSPPGPAEERLFKAVLEDQAAVLEAVARSYRARAQTQGGEK
ncbi:MAG: hypothetical protein QW260_06230, partial [Thermoproteota archaeon]